MNNRSIAWWLRQIGLSQYTKILESEYYGLEVSGSVKCFPQFVFQNFRFSVIVPPPRVC